MTCPNTVRASSRLSAAGPAAVMSARAFTTRT
jgi:hypothetical protein